MKKTLLALDDELSILKILDFYFNKSYHVVAKQNGKDALEWMQQGVIPDVIIALLFNAVFSIFLNTSNKANTDSPIHMAKA